MKKVYAEFNHARWIAICPNCQADGIISAMEVKPGEFFICPEEHPNLLAKTLVPNPRMQGALNSVPDTVLREATKQAAVQAGEAYEVVFPAESVEIERVLRMRPRASRNWTVGTTVDEMRIENELHGVNNA